MKPLSPEDIRLLTSLKTFHYLTAAQLTRLYYSRGSIKYVQAKLKYLEDEHVIIHIEEHMPYIYLLAAKGVRFLREQGADMTGYFPSDHKKHASIFLDHLLTTNDVLITAELLEKELPAITHLSLFHDLTLKRAYQGVRPDGWVGIQMNNEYVPLWLEIDMGTTDQKPFRKKIQNILNFVRSGYQSIFDTPYCTVVFLTPCGERRVAEMVVWIENELTALNETSEADLFRIGEITEDPLCLFTHPVHKWPFSNGATVSLL